MVPPGLRALSAQKQPKPRTSISPPDATSTTNRGADNTNLELKESERSPPPPSSDPAIGERKEVELMDQVANSDGQPRLPRDSGPQPQNKGERRQVKGGKSLPRNDAEIRNESLQGGREDGHRNEAQDEQINTDGAGGDANKKNGLELHRMMRAVATKRRITLKPNLEGPADLKRRNNSVELSQKVEMRDRQIDV
ncbi:hypothetical protein PMIN07_009091 [Paraphaeosphaeria minitans]